MCGLNRTGHPGFRGVHLHGDVQLWRSKTGQRGTNRRRSKQLKACLQSVNHNLSICICISKQVSCKCHTSYLNVENTYKLVELKLYLLQTCLNCLERRLLVPSCSVLERQSSTSPWRGSPREPGWAVRLGVYPSASGLQACQPSCSLR